ncbi:L,D-transpeptidase family protein [Chelatococcus reniformis]|uniref:L,D-TPase catalytic domain-containing protein n=1 Tax=Chelatococcus reniformis TaxID=1494448 RepID=A0A916U867_9HYPH|nr:murein L,D-transpeptidase family protein [Chelatococcus reniformis]GGC63315.1 hypothetical protein GCM10010994_22430 [Chelatococcus reniformis]
MGFAKQFAKHLAPIPASTQALMAARGTSPSAPVLIRVYKREAELQVWKLGRNGRYVFLKTFPICRWSGQLGPKRRVGDRQAPEGFYAITPRLMNPNSAYYLSFDTGFPNAYDRAQNYTGSALMVHGTCSSMGCYAMTDKGIGEIFAIVREAFAGGQQAFQFQAFPFRMTAENMARHRNDPNIDFWRQLKEGSDRFEATGAEPAAGLAGGRYAFAPYRDRAKEAEARARVSDQAERIATLIADGSASVRTTYADGGTNTAFAALARIASPALGVVSRPEALAFAGREVVIIPARKLKPPPTEIAKATIPARPVQVAFTLAGPTAQAAFVPLPAAAAPAAAQSRIDLAHAPASAEPILLGLTRAAEGDDAPIPLVVASQH